MNAHTEVRRLLDQIRVVSNNPVVLKASDQIEVLTRGYMSAESPDLVMRTPLRHMLSEKQHRLFLALLNRRGHTLTKSELMDAAYFDSPQEAQVKILDVFMCKLRKRLVNTDYEDAIQSVWGVGWRMKTESEMTQDKAA